MLFNINHAAIYKKFIVPTNGLTRQQAEQQIFELISNYSEDIQFDEKMGQVYINGSTTVPHSKDFWFPMDDKGIPDIQIMPFQGTDLNEDVMLNWFAKQLKVFSNIPNNRFDENGGGNIFNDTAEMTRDEVKFSTYIKRLRTIFKEIIAKPLKIKMILDFPELENNQVFLNSIRVNFNSNDLFEEWKMLNNLSKRSEIASTLSSNLLDSDGKAFLHILFIAKKIMKFTDEELDENNKYKFLNANAGSVSGEGGGSPQGGSPQAEGGTQTQGGGAPQGQAPTQGGQPQF
jgi:hypothetical protein